MSRIGPIGAIQGESGAVTARLIERLDRRLRKVELRAVRAYVDAQTIETIEAPVVTEPATAFAQSFSAATTWSIAGTTHDMATADIIVQCYNAETGDRWVVEPDTVQINSSSYDVTITWAVAQAGRVVMRRADASATFASGTSWVMGGGSHNQATADLIVHCYDAATGTRQFVFPDDITINETTFDITVGWAVAQAGRIVVLKGRYARSPASSTTWFASGATHGLNTPDLIVGTQTVSGGNRIYFEPGGTALTVNATTADVTVTLASAQAGRMVLA